MCNKSKFIARAFLVLAIIGILAGCNTGPNGEPNAIWLATVDASIYQTQVANDMTNPEEATAMANYHATRIVQENGWLFTQTPPSPTPTDTPTPTQTPTPTATPLGGNMGVCIITNWSNPSQYLGEYPPGIEPQCSENSAECVGKHIYCYRQGVMYAEFGIAIEEPVIKATRPYWEWIILLAMGIPLIIVLVFAAPIGLNYMKAVTSEQEFGPVASKKIHGESSVRAEHSNAPQISIKELNRLMRRWDKISATFFFKWLFQKEPAWQIHLSSDANPFVLTAGQWYQLLTQWDKPKTGKFIKWMEKTS